MTGSIVTDDTLLEDGGLLMGVDPHHPALHIHDVGSLKAV